MKGGACAGGSFESSSTGSQAAAEQSMYNTAKQIECTYASATGNKGGGRRRRKVKKSRRKRKSRKSRKSRKKRTSRKKRKSRKN